MIMDVDLMHELTKVGTLRIRADQAHHIVRLGFSPSRDEELCRARRPTHYTET